MDNNELQHHGILGMKWGVRRYQNYDGSYTQRGLARYNKSKAEYDSASENKKKTKEAYKQGTATKSEYKQAKRVAQNSKEKLKSDYSRLKTDRMADEGKKLYASGKTITSNTRKAYLTQAAVVVGSAAANSILASKTGNSKLAAVTASTIATGGTAVNALLAVKAGVENRNLRAYYAH